MRVYGARIAFALLVGGFHAAFAQTPTGEIAVTILYDNTVFAEGATANWGFSCFIQTATDTVLFDGGARDCVQTRTMVPL